jgi:hypothetical protein
MMFLCTYGCVSALYACQLSLMTPLWGNCLYPHLQMRESKLIRENWDLIPGLPAPSPLLFLLGYLSWHTPVLNQQHILVSWASVAHAYNPSLLLGRLGSGGSQFQSRQCKNFTRLHFNQWLGMVARVCHPSNDKKHKIESKSRLAWAKKWDPISKLTSAEDNEGWRGWKDIPYIHVKTA